MPASRRTTNFIDGSAFRHTLRKAYFGKFRHLEETIAVIGDRIAKASQAPHPPAITEEYGKTGVVAHSPFC